MPYLDSNLIAIGAIHFGTVLMLLLAWTRRLYRLLSADASPSAIAFGIAFGVVLGCVPITSGFGMVLILATLVFRVQLSSVLLAMSIAKLLIAAGGGFAFVPIGELLLEATPLRPFWASALSMPIVAWLDLDSLGVMGGVVVGLLVGAASFWLVRDLVVSYRRWVHDRISKNRFFTTVTNFWFIKLVRFIFIGGEVATS